MAEKIPNALEMTALKYGESSDDEKDRVAAQLRDAGRRAEALLLFEGRGDHPFLIDEIAWAIREGAVFHLLSIRELGASVSDDQIGRVAAAAEQRGRFLEARRCYEILGDEAALARVTELLPERCQPSP